jgi:integrase
MQKGWAGGEILGSGRGSVARKEIHAMKRKVSLRTYRGKDRIYCPAPGTTNISRLFIWDASAGEYLPPRMGKLYLARRYERNQEGVQKRVARYFEELAEARIWQSHREPRQEAQEALIRGVLAGENGPLFRDVVAEWRHRKYSGLAEGTCGHYDQLISLHFDRLMSHPIGAITSKVVDNWLTDLKAKVGTTHQSRQRRSFDHELTLLALIFRYYDEYHEDDEAFSSPIKKRHWKDSKLKVNLPVRLKDIPERDFLAFRDALAGAKFDRMLMAFATVQYFQAHRVCETAALEWGDLHLDRKEPRNSRLRVKQHVIWARKRGAVSKIVQGLKNTDHKEQPIFPESYESLKTLFYVGAKGLVFHQGDGTFFTYRQIASAYDRGFKKAGLPYRSTHIMRHGGTQRAYNETGDLDLAGQLLGNTDPETVRVYAKRRQHQLSKHVSGHWDRVGESAPSIAVNSDLAGRNWSQIEGADT